MNKEAKEGQLKIVSDGTSMGTRLYMGDTWVRGVCEININPITADSAFTNANITFEKMALDIALKDADIDVFDPVTALNIKEAILGENKNESGSNIVIVDASGSPKIYNQYEDDQGRIILEIKESD